jgi:predicted dehydrogenase
MKEQDRYGVALLGAGWVAGEYVRAVRDHPRTDLIGIYNRTPGKATGLLQAHGVLAREYSSEDELFDDELVHVVVSCTPPDARVGHVVRAARTGRHVVIEKPVALSWSGVKAIYNAITEAGVTSVTSFVLRWNPQFDTLKQLIADGVVGETIYAEADYWHPITRAIPAYAWVTSQAIGGSAIVAGGCHAVDALRYLAGEINQVSAYSAPGKRNTDYEYDPTIVASMKLANGGIGKVSTLCDGDTPYEFNVRVFGTNGSIQNNRVYSSKHYPGATGYWAFPTVPPDSGDVSHHPFRAELAHFIQCIDEGREPNASIRDSYRTMAVCFAIDESAARGGQPVTVDYAVRDADSVSQARAPATG